MENGPLEDVFHTRKRELSNMSFSGGYLSDCDPIVLLANLRWSNLAIWLFLVQFGAHQEREIPKNSQDIGPHPPIRLPYKTPRIIWSAGISYWVFLGVPTFLLVPEDVWLSCGDGSTWYHGAIFHVSFWWLFFSKLLPRSQLRHWM